MDKRKAEAIGGRVRELLTEVMREEFGLTVDRTSGTYGATSYVLKIEFAESAGGVVMNQDAERLVALYEALGFAENPLGKTFNVRGRTFKLVGVRSRGTNNMIAEALDDGKRYKFNELAVRRMLGAKIADWEEPELRDSSEPLL